MSVDRLQDLLSKKGNLLSDDTLIETRRVPSAGSSVSGSEGSVVVHKDRKAEQPLRIRTKNLELDQEDDFNDYVIDPPLPPPTELNPGKLYALYEFSGDDPSHCELERDDAVTLLNDQDGYWWLVRKDTDAKIGFAPAECLETYDERLARLNCWKNEERERNSKETLEQFPDTKVDKMNKSVTFSEEVTITEHDGNDDNDDDDDDDDDNEDRDAYEPALVDEGPDDDEVGDNDLEPLDAEVLQDLDANSENMGSEFFVAPLVVKKNKPKNVFEESDTEESPFLQPHAFFASTNGSGSIGTYSPSSSEFDSPESLPHRRQSHESPQDVERRGNIPQSKGTRDIAKSMQLLDDLINDEMNTAASINEDGDCTLTYDNESTDKLSSPISFEGAKKNLSNLTSSTFSNSNISLHKVISSGTASSVDADIHPEIEALFKDSLGKMDALSQRLKDLDRLLK